MKRIAVLMACMTLLLCACGAPEQEATQPVSQTTTAAAQIQAESTTPVQQETEAPTETVNSALELAKSCIDQPVEELYALIGQPERSDYAPSCLDGAQGEDGNLYYDGFVVYTYREGDTETVRYVE